MRKRWLTQAEYAAKYKLTRSAVCQAVKAGRLHRRTSDGKVDGLVDIRTKIPEDNRTNEQLRREKLMLQNDLMRIKLKEEREKIGMEYVRADFSVFAEIVDDFRKEITPLDLSVRQSEGMREALRRLHGRITARLSSLLPPPV